MGVQKKGRTLAGTYSIFSIFPTRSWRVSLITVLLVAVLFPQAGRAGLDVMTNHELGELEGGHLIEMAISQNDFYGSTTEVTVVRFSSDIYIESYGEVGALKMGNYPRTLTELGDMASMDSNYTMVYGPQDRGATRRGRISGNFTGYIAGDNPYMSNPNRTDRIHDRYSDGGGGSVLLGDLVDLRSGTTPWNYFGSNQCSAHPETQWDVNWENLQMGVSAQYPMRLYGLVLRAEFSNWGESNQMLRRFALGSNNLYGYSSVRPLVTSGWLNSEMSKLASEAYALTNQVCFQLQRDPILDQYWALSSFNFNPDTSSDGSFRQFWFNTNMDQISSGNPNNDIANYVGNYQDKNQGFFLLIDMTDRRFSGWNIVGGVNEYRNWPPLEQDADHYFENEFITWRTNNVD